MGFVGLYSYLRCISEDFRALTERPPLSAGFVPSPASWLLVIEAASSSIRFKPSDFTSASSPEGSSRPSVDPPASASA